MLRTSTRHVKLVLLRPMQLRMKRKIIYTDKTKERMLRISYNPRTEPVPRKHLILQQREEEQRNKLQDLIDEFSHHTEPRFESSMFEFTFTLTYFSSIGTLDDVTRQNN
jgi:hypothetical protein